MGRKKITKMKITSRLAYKRAMACNMRKNKKKSISTKSHGMNENRISELPTGTGTGSCNEEHADGSKGYELLEIGEMKEKKIGDLPKYLSQEKKKRRHDDEAESKIKTKKNKMHNNESEILSNVEDKINVDNDDKSRRRHITTSCTSENEKKCRVRSAKRSHDEIDISTTKKGKPLDSKQIQHGENEHEDPLPYEIEVEITNEKHIDNPTGHRIIKVDEFFNDLTKIAKHKSLFDCGFETLKIDCEKQAGLVSIFKISCQMCQEKFSLKTSSEDVNKKAISGMMAAGCGNAQLNQFTASVDLPNVSQYMYDKNQDRIGNEWELTSWEEMKKAGEREREAAIKEGRLNKDGIPLIDVILDGCWCKRSYKTNYAALSGAAAIIGKRFGQVLFMSVKNKYCCICARAEKKGENIKEHICYKNFIGASTAMESDIIVEGFKKSIEMHNVIYARFIADGDSSTYAKILEARPYADITVEKINCKNHILRNFCNKMQQLKSDTKYSVTDRKTITNEKILSTRKYITDAMKLHGSKTEDVTEKIKALHRDITLSIYHGFGIHEECNKEICSRETKSENTSFTKGILWQRLRYLVTNVSSHSRSLIENVDSNIVESFNGVIAKFTGGKRINYALKRSYQVRCAGAVVAFNSKKILSTVQQNIEKTAPSDRLKKFENKQEIKRKRNRNVNKKKKRYVAVKKTDKNYGENADKPDMDAETFELSKTVFLKNLEKTEKERQDIQKRTILQSDSGEWMELRRNMLTASNFGKVVKRNIHNSCKNIVKSMLYKPNIDHVASISHGKKNEKTALTQLSSLLNVPIDECGLFIDDEYPFLGATPDGIIPEQNTIVEVKCPMSPFKIGIEESIKQGKMHFWRKNKKGETYINKRSDWYMQMQGQMHISKASKCILAVWYGENKIKTETIMRDDKFWSEIMEPKLKIFYFDCLLPELVDPRHTRQRPIRDPDYVKVKSPKNDKENVCISNKTKDDNIVILQDNSESNDIPFNQY